MNKFNGLLYGIISSASFGLIPLSFCHSCHAAWYGLYECHFIQIPFCNNSTGCSSENQEDFFRYRKIGFANALAALIFLSDFFSIPVMGI